MNRALLDRIALGGASLLLCAGSMVRIVERGGPYFERPRTVMDHAGPNGHETRQALLVLAGVKPMLPRGAVVTCFRPHDGKTWDDDAIYLTAVGLLPHQWVVPPWAAKLTNPRDELAEYVIAAGAPFEHPAYGVVAGFPDGWLYKLR